MKVKSSHLGRVVKAWDLKSHGVTRAGSNPADDAFLFILLFDHYSTTSKSSRKDVSGLTSHKGIS